jgi:hypothetical protein
MRQVGIEFLGFVSLLSSLLLLAYLCGFMSMGGALSSVVTLTTGSLG